MKKKNTERGREQVTEADNDGEDDECVGHWNE
jgi:hypothetical protein